MGSVTTSVEPSVEASPPDGSASGRSPSRRRLRSWVVAAAVLLLVWLLGAIALLGGAYSSLRATAEAMPEARDAVAGQQLDAARDAVEVVRSEARTAAGRLRSPVLAPLRILPVIGADLRVATDLAVASADLGDAVDEVFVTLDKLPGGLGALAPSGGRLPVDALGALAPPLRLAAAATAAATERVAGSSPSGRLAQVVDARETALELLDPLAAQLGLTARLAGELPWLLGADAPRTFLFAASTPAALGGTGGFLGSITLLTIDDGQLDFGDFEATNLLENLPPGTLPAPVAEDATRWGRYGGTGAWLTLNRSPHFPAAASAMQRLWEETRGDQLDGMIVADPFALEALLEFAGPQQVPDLGTIAADEVVAYMTNEAYDDFDDPNEERKEVLGEVAAAAFSGFLDSADEPDLEVVSRLGELISGGHLLVHADDEQVQAALSSAGATGELGDGRSDLVSVVLNHGSASKVDFYAERRISHKVSLRSDGSARSELEVWLRNDAPTSGPPRYVIGPNNPRLDAGDNLANVSVYAGRGSEFDQVPVASPDLPSFTETELGYAVTDGWVLLASGEEVTRRYGWRTPDAWSVDADGNIAYDLLFQGQTTIRPTSVTIQVHVPQGLEPVSVPDGAEFDGGAIVWSGEIRGDDVALPIRLRSVSG